MVDGTPCRFLLEDDMAKGKYAQWITELGLGKIEAWCEDGLTNEELAKAMGVNPDTLYRWQKEHPEISEAITRGRGGALVQIKNALFERARGGIRIVRKPVKIRRREYHGTTGKLILDEEEIQFTEEEIYVPPDTNAIKFWLTNRDPEHWSNKVEVEGIGELQLEDLLRHDK